MKMKLLGCGLFAALCVLSLPSLAAQSPTHDTPQIALYAPDGMASDTAVLPTPLNDVKMKINSVTGLGTANSYDALAVASSVGASGRVTTANFMYDATTAGNAPDALSTNTNRAGGEGLLTIALLNYNASGHAANADEVGGWPSTIG